MTLSIKDHIDQGHYPKDEKGRALVPMACGEVATIYATDHNDGAHIIHGRINVHDYTPTMSWAADGSTLREHVRLLPPPPRKVEVKRWVEYDPADDYFSGHWGSDKPNGGVTPRKGCVIIELTGSYEEEW